MSSMSFNDALRLEREDDVVTIWLNRPSKRNAVDFAMWQAMPALLDEILTAAPRVVLIRGVGGHFCAGADISELGERLADVGVPGGYREVNAAAEAAFMAFPLPVIAVIEGNCIGGGWQIASVCDLRIASRSMLIGITPSKLGITYPPEAISRTVALVGPAATKRLLYTAELIDGAEALRLGFVDQLVDDDALDHCVAELVAQLAGRSLLTQTATKLLVNSLVTDDESLRARHDQLALDSKDGPDLHEGLTAFKERRPPTFSWRP